MRKIFFLAAVLALAACAHQDRPQRTSFTPIDGNGFQYQAVGDAAYPEYSKVAEASRLQALQQYLDQYHLCPQGYKITSRSPKPVNGNVVEITYLGVCS
jgi:hypothetical protein